MAPNAINATKKPALMRIFTVVCGTVSKARVNCHVKTYFAQPHGTAKALAATQSLEELNARDQIEHYNSDDNCRVDYGCLARLNKTL